MVTRSSWKLRWPYEMGLAQPVGPIQGNTFGLTLSPRETE